MCTMPKRVASRSYVGRMVPERAECRLASLRRGVMEVPRSVIVTRRLSRDAAVFDCHLHDGPAVELPDGRSVKLLPRRGALRDLRQASGLASCNLLGAHQHVTGAGREVYANAITGAQPRQATTGGALW